MPADHPALVFSNQSKEIFGLGDPMVIAVINDGEHGIFNPETLQLIAWLTRGLEAIDNIDPAGITSLATENNIVGTEEGMEISPFFEFDQPPKTLDEAQALKRAVMDFPLYRGTLVAEDSSGALIIAELLDETAAQPVYDAMLKLVESAPIQAGETVHVAGEGAVIGYFGHYVDADAARLNPLSALVITLLCFVAFRTIRGGLLPNFIVIATLAAAIGFMAAVGIKFFVVTNALPVILIAIAVADSIHILTEYYQQASQRPGLSPRELTVLALTRIWRAITLTSLTTMAGFLGLALASIMPPMKFFGVFALFGVGAAWLFSLIVLPAILCLLKVQISRAYPLEASVSEKSGSPAQAGTTGETVDIFGKSVQIIGRTAVRFPKLVVCAALLLVVAGLHGSSKIYMNESMMRAFQPDEPIVLADTAINQRFDGSYFFDITVETPDVEGLFDPENLKKIEALQTHMEAHPLVKGSTSIVDYLKQMHRSMHGNDTAFYKLPDNADLIAQYFLLYSATGDPDDLEEEIDYDYRLANVRINIKEHQYTTLKSVVEYFHDYAELHFNGKAISVSGTGRANVNYHWMQRLGETHFVSLGVALLLVLLMAAASFRSVAAGLFCLLPIALTMLGIYAVMGYGGIWLSISSSMCASMAIGVGVDFSIHTTERLQTTIRRHGELNAAGLSEVYATTGRALLFNFLALALGFGTILLSKVSFLQEFGALIALAVTLSFIASLTLLPALTVLLKPRFLGFAKAGSTAAIAGPTEQS